VAVGAIGVLAPAEAHAHFILQDPPSWMSQDSLGTPEKLGPCGDEGGGTASGTVTAFSPGQTITVTVNEVIFHPGHYRIALSVTDRNMLPPEPNVTPGGGVACGTADIMSPAVFPVLADDVFDHTAPFGGPQSVQITLPTNVTCTHCTLQVIEFMSQHGLNNPGGCFYHHCADISIQGPAMDGGGPVDSGGGGDASSGGPDASGGGPDASGGGPDASSGGPDASSSPDAGGAPMNGATPSSSGGCSCSFPMQGAPAAGGFAGLLVLASLLRLRRRR
jgi:MYXO-CTERM domain-containing protein